MVAIECYSKIFCLFDVANCITCCFDVGRAWVVLIFGEHGCDGGEICSVVPWLSHKRDPTS